MRISSRWIGLLGLFAPCLLSAQRFRLYVSPSGKDTNPGTFQAPLATWQQAVKRVNAVKRAKAEKKEDGNPAVTVYFRGGTYYLTSTIRLDRKETGSAKEILFAACPGEKVVISGARRFHDLKWEAWKNGIFRTKLNDFEQGTGRQPVFDQLYVNGVRQVRARFPNYDYTNPLRSGNGYQQVTGGSNDRVDTWLEYDPVIFSRKNWSDPSTGIVHAFQSKNWGNRQYRVRSVDTLQHRILLGEGGWQMQREGGIGKARGAASPFFVENILEELDTVGEWFYDSSEKDLYYYPSAGTDLNKPGTKIELTALDELVRITGDHIALQGFCFTQTCTDFMEIHEPMGRGDWAIHRGGAVVLEGAEDCQIRDCSFEYVGGNAVFMNKYNRRNKVSGCRFFHTGESAVCFVGDTASVRSYLTWDAEQIRHTPWSESRKAMDPSPGPRTPDYPEDCIVENCIASELGDFGKQVAAVFISMSHRIRIAYTTIYNVPRAAVCINDGNWGGHIIEHCDIWEAVRETGEHGPFNSWGRDRYWSGSGELLKQEVLLDATDPTTIRNNRIANYRKSISAGNWTIDLDDGSSNYLIYNNLSLGSTLKLRDGYYRKVWNNIFVSAVPLGWHVWPDSSGDVFTRNITVISGRIPGNADATAWLIKPIGMPEKGSWGSKIDSNLYYNFNEDSSFRTGGDPVLVSPGIRRTEWQAKGYDRHSLFRNPLFANPSAGNYTVIAGSPALNIGFRNFRMDLFGQRMTRIEPFGGEFKDSKSIAIKADDRGGQVRYTTDGSQPTTRSALYTKPLRITRTTTLRARTFRKGIAVGFETEATFSRVAVVSYPSWLETLLEGQTCERARHGGNKSAEKKTWLGASLSNIADGDLIDATGGAENAVYLEVPSSSAAWRAGLRTGDILLKVNGQKISRPNDLDLPSNAATDLQTLTIRRMYEEITITLSKNKKQL